MSFFSKKRRKLNDLSVITQKPNVVIFDYDGTINDNKKLQEWKDKNTKYYNNAITTCSYNQRKDILQVYTGDIITFTIRIQNLKSAMFRLKALQMNFLNHWKLRKQKSLPT